MTIASEITRLQDVRTDIYDELGNKCVNLDGSSKYADVAPIIKKMPVVCAKIGANKYPVVKIGNQLWTAKNLDEDLGTLGTNEWYYDGRTEKTRLNSITEKTLPSGSSGDMYISASVRSESATEDRKELASLISGNKFTICGTATISQVQATDVKTNVFLTNCKKSNGSVVYPSIGMITIQAGQTSVDFVLTSSSVIENISSTDPNSQLLGIRVGNTTTAKSYSFSLTNIRCNIGTTDCGTSAMTFAQALANEATYKKYGRLYTWDNVNTNLASLGLQGWRWPNQEDYQSLASIDSTGKKLRSKSFYNGTDDYGFFAIPSGRKAVEGFDGVNTFLECWGEKDSSVVRFKITSNSCMFDNLGGKSEGRSIRLVCDLNEDGSIPDGAVIIAEADESAVATLADDEP